MWEVAFETGFDGWVGVGIGPNGREGGMAFWEDVACCPELLHCQPLFFHSQERHLPAFVLSPASLCAKKQVAQAHWVQCGW